MSNGKGSRQRPTDPITFGENYTRIQWTDDPPGHDEREKFSPPLEEPTAKALRDKHLEEAREVILNAPFMSQECRDKLDKAWATYDAAYPHELSPKDKP